jgi:hypothetical protein
MRVAVEWRSASKENYRIFCKKYPLIKLTYVEWENIIYSYNELFKEWLLETGNFLYNFNYHTEGFFFGWQWFNRSARFKHSALWRFKPSRVTSRLLAHYIKVDNKYQHLYKEWIV